MGRRLILRATACIAEAYLSRQTQVRIPCAYPVLARLSDGYPSSEGRLPTCYSPVRHFTQDRSPFLVRLACVRHAASVRSEPGSNSPIKPKSFLTRVPKGPSKLAVLDCCWTQRRALAPLAELERMNYSFTSSIYYLVFKDRNLRDFFVSTPFHPGVVTLLPSHRTVKNFSS